MLDAVVKCFSSWLQTIAPELGLCRRNEIDRSIDRGRTENREAANSTHSNPIQSRLCKCSTNGVDDGETGRQVRDGTAERNTEAGWTEWRTGEKINVTIERDG